MASVVNEGIDIPVLTENREQAVIEKIIKMIDDCLYQLLPNEIYDTNHMAGGGVRPEEANNRRLSNALLYIAENGRKRRGLPNE